MARDAARIDVILKQIGDIWKTCPDMRFFQLMICITKNSKLDLFNLEDSTFSEILTTYEKEHPKDSKLDLFKLGDSSLSKIITDYQKEQANGFNSDGCSVSKSIADYKKKTK